MGLPSITERKHFRLVPGEPEEHTSTIVLTSKDSYFVDVRLLQDKLAEEDGTEVNSEGCIEWAFAGKSHTKSQGAHKDDTTTPSHTAWDHWIDSKSNDPGLDEGAMWVQEDGNVLERGKMKDPATGKDLEYEELWHDLEVVPLGKKHNKSSLVLRADHPEQNIRGMAIKVGGWCQAILKIGDALTIERWEWKGAVSKENKALDGERKHEKRTRNDWVRTFKFGEEILPCEYMCSNTDGKIGSNKPLRYNPSSANTLWHNFVSYNADDESHSETGWRVLEEYYCHRNEQARTSLALVCVRRTHFPIFTRDFDAVTVKKRSSAKELPRDDHLRLMTACLLANTFISNPLTTLRRQLIILGFLKYRSHEVLREMYGAHEPGIMLPALLPKPPIRDSIDGIGYIPAQQDPMALSTTSAARQSPVRLFLEDAGVLLRSLPYLPNIFLPFKTNNPSNELYLNLAGMRDMILQGWLFITETFLLLLAIPAILVLPGLIWGAGLALSCLAIWLITKPTEGLRIAYSNMSHATLATAEQRRDERWLFVNGCTVGYSGLQKNIDRLAETFGRAIIGIHNVTYGLPADILECLVQRCFAYSSMDVRVTHSYVKATLLDPTVNKVVLIGHSQGGIIVSLVIDELFTELPASCMSKLEIYTFGSAASHFSNPLISMTSKTDANHQHVSPTKIHFDRPTNPKHVIAHIEHYANEKDMVPRWGVLHCTQDVLNNRYAGSVFVRMGASGHMFNQHYMDPIFPLSDKEMLQSTDGFLDRLVQVEEKLTLQRESTAVSFLGLVRAESGLEFGDGQIIPNESSVTGVPATNGINGSGDAFMTFARSNSGRLLAQEAQGKTVRQLSRLWRYQGGRSPHTPSPFPTPKPGDRNSCGNSRIRDKLEKLSTLNDGELDSPETTP